MVYSYKGEMSLVLIMSCLISFQMAQEKQLHTEIKRTCSQHWRAPGTCKSLRNGAVPSPPAPWWSVLVTGTGCLADGVMAIGGAVWRALDPRVWRGLL